MPGDDQWLNLLDFVSEPICIIHDDLVYMNSAACRLLRVGLNEPLAKGEWLQFLLQNPLDYPCVLWFTTDIEKSLNALRQLNIADARWKALAESLPGWVVQVDLDGTITWISRPPEGRSPDQVLGHNIGEFLLLKNRPEGLVAFEELVREPRFATFQTDEVLPDGRHVYHEHHVGPLMDGSKCVGFVIHTIDVTERHEREELLREQEFQIFQARKMEALGRMAGGVAHDLNNLLSVISGNLDLLSSGSCTQEIVEESLSDMRRALEEASNLVKALLSMSRGQKVTPVCVQLAEIVLRAERILRSQVGRNVKIVMEIASDVPPVVVDPGQFVQVIINLVLNARDAMPDGGTVRLCLRPLTLESELRTKTCVVPPGVYALLSVTDTGEGISEDVEPHIFEPFFTTKPSDSGTGLGLAVVYSIIQQNGGYIWFDTKRGMGTTFYVALPHAEGNTSDALWSDGGTAGAASAS